MGQGFALVGLLLSVLVVVATASVLSCCCCTATEAAGSKDAAACTMSVPRREEPAGREGELFKGQDPEDRVARCWGMYMARCRMHQGTLMV
jgi:hypothetical protein